MFVKGLRKFLYAGALLALAPIMARAEEKDGKKPELIPAPAPATVKVRVLECVPEPCEYTHTTYKAVTKDVDYTAYRCETVNETKTRTWVEYKKVCETVMETRTVTRKVPCWEDRIENVTRWRLQQVTEYKTRKVDNGHWECKTVPAGQSAFDRLCGKCPDPCATKTVKCWVPCVQTVCEPVCRTKLVKVCTPVCKKVCTYKCVNETVTCPVQKVRCIPETKSATYTECRKVMVPYQAKKTVTECVPVNEVVKGTKMVAKWVEKEVPCAPAVTCAAAPCHDDCGAAAGCGKGLRARFAKGGCCK